MCDRIDNIDMAGCVWFCSRAYCHSHLLEVGGSSLGSLTVFREVDVYYYTVYMKHVYICTCEQQLAC